MVGLLPYVRLGSQGMRCMKQMAQVLCRRCGGGGVTNTARCWRRWQLLGRCLCWVEVLAGVLVGQGIAGRAGRFCGGKAVLRQTSRPVI